MNPDKTVELDLLNIDVITEMIEVVLRDSSEACVTVKVLSERTVPVKVTDLRVTGKENDIATSFHLTNTKEKLSTLVEDSMSQLNNRVDKSNLKERVDTQPLLDASHVTSYKKSSVLVCRTTGLNLSATPAGRMVLSRLRESTGRHRWSSLGEKLDVTDKDSYSIVVALKYLALQENGMMK